MSSGGVCFKVVGAVSVLGLLVLCLGRWGWVVVLVWGLVGLGVFLGLSLKIPKTNLDHIWSSVLLFLPGLVPLLYIAF